MDLNGFLLLLLLSLTNRCHDASNVAYNVLSRIVTFHVFILLGLSLVVATNILDDIVQNETEPPPNRRFLFPAVLPFLGRFFGGYDPCLVLNVFSFLFSIVQQQYRRCL